MSRSGRLSGYGWVGGLLIAAGAVFLILGIVRIGPTARAADGRGVHGYFVATTRTCTSRSGGRTCTWSGVFERADGTIIRSGVGFIGSAPTLRGIRVPAVDTGDPLDVFQPGVSVWTGPVGYLIWAILLLAGGVLQLVRWRRRNSEGT